MTPIHNYYRDLMIPCNLLTYWGYEWVGQSTHDNIMTDKWFGGLGLRLRRLCFGVVHKRARLTVDGQVIPATAAIFDQSGHRAEVNTTLSLSKMLTNPDSPRVYAA